MIANRNIVPDINLRINFYIFPDLYIVADIGKSADKNIFTKRWLI